MFRKMIAVVLAAMLITSAAPLSAFAAETSELPSETEPAVAEPTEAVTIPPVQEKASEPTEEVTTQPVQEKEAEPVGASVDADETVGKSSFTYTVSNDQVTITGLSDEYLTDLVIPEKIEGLPVTAIKENAFNGCSQITSITVPNSVTSIGNGAFKGTNPTKVVLPFIGQSRTSTGKQAVLGYIFGEGNSTSSGAVNQIIGYFFIPKMIKEVVITDDSRISAYEFCNCDWIEKIQILGSADEISGYAFYNCKELRILEIPNEYKKIGVYSFYNCENLFSEGFVIPNTVTQISQGAYLNCRKISDILVPNSVTSISEGAFQGTNPTKITLPFIGQSRTSKDKQAVLGYVFGEGNSTSSGAVNQIIGNFYIPKTLKEVVITDDSRISAYEFCNCDWIEKIQILGSADEISGYAFYNCKELRILEIPNEYKKIGVYSFYNCENLFSEEFDIPDTVTEISQWAYLNCSEISDILVPNSVTLIGEGAFQGTNPTKITLPFIGQSRTSKDKQAVLGYIFGEGNSTSSGVVNQRIGYFYIPKTIKEVVVTDDSRISAYEFCNCDWIEKIQISGSADEIGGYAFYNCKELRVLDIPNEYKKIGVYSFYNCEKLFSEEIIVPSNVLSIEMGAFLGTKPRKLTIPFIGKSPTATGYSGVLGYIFGYSENNSNVKDAIKQYEGSGSYDFYYYIPQTIKEVTITNAVQVPENAFYNCSWIEKVTINDIEGDASVVGNNAFYNCPAMTVYVNRDTGVHTYCERNGIRHCSTKSISLDSDSLVLFRNESNTIGSEVILLNGKVDDDPETVWTSSDTDVVTVNRYTGLITAVAPGTATVTADSEGVTATAEITVYFKLEGIALNKSTAEIDINKTETLTVTYSPENTTDSKKITWKSSDDKIAQVDENGTVTAIKRGKATITATASNGAEAKCTVQVQVLVPITGIAFESDTVSNPRSTRQKVPFTLSPEDYTDTYTVTSSDTEIATVDKFGNVVAKKVGTAVITVTTSRGLEKSCTVKVYSPATAVTLSADSKTIFANRSFELKAELSPSDCTDSITWSSSDDRIAAVDKDGVVTGVSKGYATITATADSGKSADCVVTVESDFNAATVYLEYNETEYNAEDKTPEVFVYFNDERLVEDADYSLYYYNNHDAGKAGVIVTSLYDGTEVDKAFVIHPLTVTAIEISCQQTMTYTGGELKGVEDVTYQSLRLAEGVDYELKYENNTNVGKATATITGKGNFTGVTTATFTILPRPISEMTVLLESSSYRYDGTEKMPAVTVRYGAKELEEDEDYRVEYTDNLNAGDALVTVSGMGNYSGYVEKPFRIEAKSISDAKLLLEETVYLCDGAKKCPRVTVTDGETELKQGADYDVEYKNNTDVGIATVIVSGKGNYSGSASETFEIIMLGDVNADGRVDINDATLVQKAVAELVVLDEKQQKAADVTGDGKITIDDATLIQKYVAELIDRFR